MDIKGKQPAVGLLKLVKSKWPKLHEMVATRRRVGIWAQATVTGLLDQSGIEVVAVERGCDCVECAAPEGRKGRRHDVDALVKLGAHEVPIQIAVFDGELVYNHHNAVGKYGAVRTEYVTEIDAGFMRNKIRQTPPGGIALIHTNDRVAPCDAWWYAGIEGVCVVLWQKGLCRIYHGAGAPVGAARQLCGKLGYKHVYLQAVGPRRSPNPEHERLLSFCPRTARGLAATISQDVKRWTGNPDGILGALHYPSYASAYFEALSGAANAVQADGLVPVLRHVVERHKESAAEDAADERAWRRSVSDALLALERLAQADTRFSSSTLAETCSILQDVASKRYDIYACKTLSPDEIYRRLHLQALFCLTRMVGRMRDRTPQTVRETLTAAASVGGQDGMEHRVVLGYALYTLRYAMPDWYAENESLLFGQGSPDGMSPVLMRVCLYTGFPDVRTMERYRTLVLEAMGDEMRHVRRRASETGAPVEANVVVRRFVAHMLAGSRGYGVRDSVRDLINMGPDAVSAAGFECGLQISGKNTEKKRVDRGVRFWKTVLASSPEPGALYGFGRWALAESVDQDTWESLTLRTCEITGGSVDVPLAVFDRASSSGSPTKSGIRIVNLVLRANRRLFPHAAARNTLGGSGGAARP